METSNRKKLRTIFLSTLYNKCNGLTANLINIKEIAELMKIEASKAYEIAQSLNDLGYIKIKTLDGFVAITSSGILEIEDTPFPVNIKPILIHKNKNEMDFWKYLHPMIQTLARDRFENGYYSDSVLNCLREINSLLKAHSVRNGRPERDGADLITNTFSLNNPLISLADLATENGRNIQLGYMKIFEGIMIGIRNPKSHLNMTPDENKTIHLLFLASFMMVKLDESGVLN
jgi:uncharacterized protein (TIGR02391 family)